MDAPFQKYVFVCENKREDGRPSCGEPGTRLREQLKELVKAAGLASKVRVCRAGCLDACEKGPNVLIEPDHVLLDHVKESDLPKILERLR